MFEEPYLPGLEPREPTDSLFFAILPEGAALRRITLLRQQLRDVRGLQGGSPAHPHITLLHLGFYDGLPSTVITKAKAAAQKTAAATQPFSVEFDRATLLENQSKHRPFVLLEPEHNEPLMKLHRLLGRNLWGRTRNQLLPHVTLLHSKDEIPDLAITPIGWEVDKLSLIRSLQGQSEYLELGSWEFAESPASSREPLLDIPRRLPDLYPTILV
jgi:2'-5' RNA ligase